MKKKLGLKKIFFIKYFIFFQINLALFFIKKEKNGYFFRSKKITQKKM